ncbi:hypothetical protein nvc1_048 [Namao virus]|nr:hypothetical protein nvc1_048 [Namao virus]
MTLFVLLTVVSLCSCSDDFVRHVHHDTDNRHQTVFLQRGMTGSAHNVWMETFTKEIRVTMRCEMTTLDFNVEQNSVQQQSNEKYSLMASTVHAGKVKVTLDIKVEVSRDFFCVVDLTHYDDKTEKVMTMHLYYRTYHFEITDIILSKTELMCKTDTDHTLHMKYNWYYQGENSNTKIISARKKIADDQWVFGQDYVYVFQGMTASYKGCGTYTCVASDGISSVSLIKAFPCKNPLEDVDAKTEL